jgi:hypothetical protein
MLQQAHDIAHGCRETMTEQEMEESTELMKDVVNLLNQSEKGNGIKFMAVLGVLGNGVYAMQQHKHRRCRGQ